MINNKVKLALLVVLCTSISFSFIFKNEAMEAEKIKQAITENYIHGAFNNTDIEAFQRIFHPEFSIINIQENGSFFLFTREMWEEVLQRRKADKTFDYNTVSLQPKWRKIDISGDKASVTLDLLKDGNVVYTDFLLLIQIDEEWKIVSKIFNQY